MMSLNMIELLLLIEILCFFAKIWKSERQKKFCRMKKIKSRKLRNTRAKLDCSIFSSFAARAIINREPRRISFRDDAKFYVVIKCVFRTRHVYFW